MAGSQDNQGEEPRRGEPPSDPADPTHPAAPAGPSGLARDDFLVGLPKDGDTPVIGPVKLKAKISRGGMGVVYRGHHVKLDIDVAVKVLSPYLASNNPEYVLRFEREAKIAAQINNENLVRVFDIDSVKNYHYVVMELVCGETARERVLRKGQLAVEEALEIIRGATRGLEAAHLREVVHRDIKPDNILIDSSGVVKLADLGIAKVIHEGSASAEELTQTGIIMGTPGYMPPEQFFDSRSVGPAGDIYGMGATLYFLLTGKAPYTGSWADIFQEMGKKAFPDVREARSGIPSEVTAIISKCTRRNPSDRYPNASVLLRDLQKVCRRQVSLSDQETGRVRAEAKVSTPPARKFGEIRFAISDRKASSPWKKAALAAAALLFLGSSALIGVYVGIEMKRRGDSGGGEPVVSAPSPGVEAPEPEAPATAAKAAEVPPAAAPGEPPGPAIAAKDDASLEIERRKREEEEKRRREEEEARLKKAEEARRLARREEEKRMAAEADRTARVARFEKDLEEAGALLASGNLAGAERLLESLQGLEPPAPELAEQVRSRLDDLEGLKVVQHLAARPPREKEALALLRDLRGRAGAAAPGSAFEGAYRSVLEHLKRSIPGPDDDEAVWRDRIALLGDLPPPDGLAEIEGAYRELLLAGFQGLAGRVRAPLERQDLDRARKALDLAAEFGRDRRWEKQLPGEVVSGTLGVLDRSLRGLAGLEGEWSALAECRQKAGSVGALIAIPAEAVERCSRELEEFAARHPASGQAGIARRLLENHRIALWSRELLSPAQVEAAAGKGLEPAREIDLGGGIGLRFLLVPAGTHRGSAIDGFYLGVHEVTREQYERVLAGAERGPGGEADAPAEPGLPATGVSHDDAVRFCRRLEQVLAGRGIPLRLRLPAEMEWERACGAGAEEPAPPQPIERHAWYWLNAGQKAHPVGTREKSPWGFFDLLGNAGELCAAPGTSGPDSPRQAVVKGGSWNDSVHRLKPSWRRPIEPQARDEATGFRLALEP